MKKALKVLLYFFGCFILLIILALVFHDPIIQFAVERAIEGKSGGRISVKIDNFHLDLINETIEIDNPELLFTETYLNETKSLEINKLSFKSIDIEELDLIELILNRNIFAGKFLIDRPDLWFTEPGTDKKSSFHPEKLIAILNQNPDLFKKMIFRISDVEVHYGSINVTELTSPELDPGLVDFTIIFKYFNTHPDSTERKNRILYSDEFLIKLKNLTRNLKSGYQLDIDSAVFSSLKKELYIGGASLRPNAKVIEKNAISLFAGQLVLDDIELEEIRGLEDLSVRSVILSDGYFANYMNNPILRGGDTTQNEGIEQLSKLFYDFKLDTFEVQNVDYFFIKQKIDTVARAHQIDFLLTGIELDSGMFDDPFRDFIYDSVSLTTAELELDGVIPGMYVKYQGLTYSNFDRNLKVRGLSLLKDSVLANPDKVDVSLMELDIKGFSIKKFQKKQTQQLILRLIDPEVNLTFYQKENQKKTSRGLVLPKHIELEKVLFQNGNINLLIDNKTELTLKGVNIDVEKLFFPDQEDSTFRYQDLSFNYQNLIAQIENRKYQFETGALNYKNKNLLLNEINGNLAIARNNEPLNVQLTSLSLSDFDLEHLLFEKELIVRELNLNQPVLSGYLPLSQLGKSKDAQIKAQPQLAPFSIDIGNLIIDQGEFDVLTEIALEKAKINTSYSIQAEPLSLTKGDPFNSVIEKLSWDVQFTNSTIDYKDHQLTANLLLSNNQTSEFKIDSLAINSTSQKLSDQNQLEIRSLELPSLEFTGLDYKLLIENDSADFHALRLYGIKVDVVLPKNKKQVDTSHKINLDKYFFFRYDTLSLSDVEVNLENPDDLSHRIIKLKGLNFDHLQKKTTSSNLIEEISFDFDFFSFEDTIKNKYAFIDKGYADAENQRLVFQGIEVSNSTKYDSVNLEGMNSSIKFKSNQIKFNNIYVRDQFPTKIHVGNLNVADLDLEFRLAEKNKVAKSDNTTINVNLEILKRFSNIITRLSLDTTRLNDINFRYRLTTDTSDSQIKLDSVAFIVHDFKVDTSMITQSAPKFISNLSIDLRGRTHITKDSLYEIKTGRLHYDFPNHRISVDSFFVTPRYGDSLFFEKSVHQTDRTILFGKKIIANDFHLDDLLNKKILHVGSVDLQEFDISMYRNKLYPFRPGIQPKFPREALMSIKQALLIDSVRLMNSRLAYKEFDEKSSNPGEVYFTDFNLTGYNVTNILKENDHECMLKVNLDAKIMGTSKMNISMFFPLYTDTTVFWLQGKTEEIDLVSLNSMTENLLGLGITHGKGSVEIPLIKAHDSLVTGALTFKYKKLRLAVYNRKKEELNTSLISPVINFLINDLVVRSNNPKMIGKTRIGEVYFKRDTRKGIVNYAWKGVLSGLLSTIGFNNKEQRQERKEMKKAP